MVRRVRVGGSQWKIIAVYVREGVSRSMEELRGWMEGSGEKVRTIIGRDAKNRKKKRRGKKCGEKEEGIRELKDKKVNKKKFYQKDLRN